MSPRQDSAPGKTSLVALGRSRSRCDSIQTKTPSKLGSRDEMGDLEKLVKKQSQVGWTIWFSERWRRHMMRRQRSQRIYVDLPRFDFPVVSRESET
ncbi:hypothetical protein F4604DRAFT_1034975 [Suillus subluteus]|nr:hypothetical protein F4604DRAFT_1034975 [Suillus subluteus]